MTLSNQSTEVKDDGVTDAKPKPAHTPEMLPGRWMFTVLADDHSKVADLFYEDEYGNEYSVAAFCRNLWPEATGELYDFAVHIVNAVNFYESIASPDPAAELARLRGIEKAFDDVVAALELVQQRLVILASRNIPIGPAILNTTDAALAAAKSAKGGVS